MGVDRARKNKESCCIDVDVNLMILRAAEGYDFFTLEDNILNRDRSA